MEIKQSLEHSEFLTETKDGMDIAVCAINTTTHVAQFSGAFNNLYLIRNKEMVVYKGDHQPIGVFDEEKEFVNHEFTLQKNDTIYMFTDGYVDQFGGEYGRKFLIRNFKQLLLEIAHLPMTEQKDILENTLDKWKQGYSQIDDILILGFKI